MHDGRIRRNDPDKVRIELWVGRSHMESRVDLGNVRNNHGDACDAKGDEDNGERRVGLDEGDLACSQELDDEELHTRVGMRYDDAGVNERRPYLSQRTLEEPVRLCKGHQGRIQRSNVVVEPEVTGPL